MAAIAPEFLPGLHRASAMSGIHVIVQSKVKYFQIKRIALSHGYNNNFTAFLSATGLARWIQAFFYTKFRERGNPSAVMVFDIF